MGDLQREANMASLRNAKGLMNDFKPIALWFASVAIWIII